MDTNWEIESFNDYEFRDDNLYINVSWTNTNHTTLPEINSEMRSIAIVYKKGDYQYLIEWEDSWIPITQINPGDKWNQFYQTTILPIMQTLRIIL